MWMKFNFPLKDWKLTLGTYDAHPRDKIRQQKFDFPFPAP